VNAKDISLAGIKLKIMDYGKSGTGKTTFACTFPTPYIFDWDRGMLSQRGKDVEYETCTDYTRFLSNLNKVTKDDVHETIVIDSVTILEKAMMQHILLLNNRTEPTIHEWGRLVDSMVQLLIQLTKIDKHVVVVAHEQMVQDELTQAVEILPLIVGKKLPGQIPLWFDEVYRMEMGKDTAGNPCSIAHTVGTQKFCAKSRLGVLEPKVQNLTYTGIMSKVK